MIAKFCYAVILIPATNVALYGALRGETTDILLAQEWTIASGYYRYPNLLVRVYGNAKKYRELAPGLARFRTNKDNFGHRVGGIIVGEQR